MNLGQLIGELMARADGIDPDARRGKREEKPLRVVKVKRETTREKLDRVLAGGKSLAMNELREAMPEANRQSLCVLVSTLCATGYLRKEGVVHSYRYRLARGS